MGVTAMKRNILCILLLFGIVVCMTGCNINNIFKTEEEKNEEKCQQGRGPRKNACWGAPQTR